MRLGKSIRQTADGIDSWLRVAVILGIVVLNGIWEELLILLAELMMFVRWSRDVVRYDLRWAVQEKLQLMRGRSAPNED